jgi:hypothetical protein
MRDKRRLIITVVSLIRPSIAAVGGSILNTGEGVARVEGRDKVIALLKVQSAPTLIPSLPETKLTGPWIVVPFSSTMIPLSSLEVIRVRFSATTIPALEEGVDFIVFVPTIYLY